MHFTEAPSRKPAFPALFIVQMGIIHKNIIPHDAPFSNRKRSNFADFAGFSALSTFAV